MKFLIHGVNMSDNMTTEKSKRVIKHLRHKKWMYVMMLGGKCSEPGCNYDKNLAALEFHHPNEKDKDMENWRSPKFKAEECVLYCSNHHREHHFPALSNFKDTTDGDRSQKIKEGLAKRKAMIVRLSVYGAKTHDS